MPHLHADQRHVKGATDIAAAAACRDSQLGVDPGPPHAADEDAAGLRWQQGVHLAAGDLRQQSPASSGGGGGGGAGGFPLWCQQPEALATSDQVHALHPQGPLLPPVLGLQQAGGQALSHRGLEGPTGEGEEPGEEVAAAAARLGGLKLCLLRW